MEAERPRVGYTDLLGMPDDGRQYELYDGELCVVPAPFPRHQRVTREILAHLYQYAETHGGEVLISPIDIVFSEYDVLMPDLVFFQGARRDLIDPDKAIRTAPDLAVEVLSASTAARDRGRKLEMYARYGVREYWIVDPQAKRLEIYRLDGQHFMLEERVEESDMVRSAVLPELEFPATAIFEG